MRGLQVAGVDDALLGREGLRRGEHPRTGTFVDALVVLAAQAHRLHYGVFRVQSHHRVAGLSGCHDAGHGVVFDVRIEVECAHSAQRFGHDVIDLETCPRGCHRGQYLPGEVADLLPTQRVRALTAALQQRRQGAFDTVDVAALEGVHRRVPRRALLGLTARFLLRRAGFQRRLLVQIERLFRRRWAPVVGAELGLQRPGACFDLRAARGEMIDPLRRDARDLPHRATPARGGAFGELHPQSAVQLTLQSGVVPLRRGHGRLVHHLPIEGAPLAVVGVLHLVRDRDMGVQVRLSRARITVHERCRDQPVHLHVPHTLRAASGVGDFVFEPFKRRCDGRVVRVGHGISDVAIPQRPQHRRALDRRERQVVPGHGLAVRACGTRDVRVQLALIGCTSVLVFERGTTHGGADRGTHLGRYRVFVRASVVLQPRLVRLSRLDLEGAGLVLVVGELAAHLRGVQRLLGRVSLADQGCFDAVSVGVASLPEQRDHLLFRD